MVQVLDTEMPPDDDDDDDDVINGKQMEHFKLKISSHVLLWRPLNTMILE